MRTLFTVPGFLEPSECRRLIQEAEERGFSDAPITTSRGFVMMPEVRNNMRVMFDDFELATRLWSKLEPHLAGASYPGALGLNERFRFYRYDPGQAFRWHRDGRFVRDSPPSGGESGTRAPRPANKGPRSGPLVLDSGRGEHLKEASRLTFMVYLNEDFGGGATEFDFPKETVRPREGMALVFDHGLQHQGAEVTRGTKYVLRSDVMYAR